MDDTEDRCKSTTYGMHVFHVILEQYNNSKHCISETYVLLCEAKKALMSHVSWPLSIAVQVSKPTGMPGGQSFT
jgi:hypothetical protein